MDDDSKIFCCGICKKSFSERETFDQHFKMTHMPTILKSKYETETADAIGQEKGTENNGTESDPQHEKEMLITSYKRSEQNASYCTICDRTFYNKKHLLTM